MCPRGQGRLIRLHLCSPSPRVSAPLAAAVSVNNISSKLGHLEEKFTGFDKQSREIDVKLSKRCTDLEENLKELELDVKFIGNKTSDLESSTTAKIND